MSKTLHLGLPFGDGVGWSTCSRHLREELPKLVPTYSLQPKAEEWHRQDIDGPLFMALQDISFNPYCAARGTSNYGYSFFEYEINPETSQNAKKYDTIFVGSTWCKERLLEQGVKNVEVLIQGADLEHYRSTEAIKPNDLKDKFVIYSGGKFELRKGQDLVLRALQIFQQKYENVHLITNWFNAFPAVIEQFKMSSHIVYNWDPKYYQTWPDLMMRFYISNGLDPSRISTIPGLLPASKLPSIYHSSDLGIFPNRCEGGTNLVLMEYMACGKPIVGSYTSGHKDILTEDNSLLLKKMIPFDHEENGNKLFRWEEADIDEILEKLEYAYHHREEIRKIGLKGRATIEKLSWASMARALVDKINFS